MERKRAAERNEVTAEVLAARNRRLKDENEKLKAWKAERLRAGEETAAERERLAVLLEDLADHVERRLYGELEFGAGVQRRTVTDEDLLRAAELIYPDS